MTRRLYLALAALCLLGCSASNNDPGKRYPFLGEIKALDPPNKSATIAAGKIGDWMEAMTMDYIVKPDSDFAKLHVGDHIQAVMVVKDPGYYVTDVKVMPK